MRDLRRERRKILEEIMSGPQVGREAQGGEEDDRYSNPGDLRMTLRQYSIPPVDGMPLSINFAPSWNRIF